MPSVLWGTILGPILFSLYNLSLGHIISHFVGISYHLFNDIQLYLYFNIKYSVHPSLLQSCLVAAQDWMAVHFSAKLSKIEKTIIYCSGLKPYWAAFSLALTKLPLLWSSPPCFHLCWRALRSSWPPRFSDQGLLSVQCTRPPTVGDHLAPPLWIAFPPHRLPYCWGF